MSSSRSHAGCARLIARLLVGFVIARGANAQALPGSQPSDAPGTYARLVRVGVDSALMRWMQAAESHDAAAIARLYAADAAIYPAFGNAIHGRRAIGDAFLQTLPRVSHARFAIDKVDASGDLASVVAELTYDVTLESGGSYERRDRVQLAMMPVWNVGWTIASQSGSDFAPRIAWATPPRKRLAIGQSDTLTVRVTDALGGGIPDVLVAFAPDAAGGNVWPAGVRTNARGEAIAYRTAGAHEGVGEIRVTTAIAPEDALLATLTTVAAGITDGEVRTP